MCRALFALQRIDELRETMEQWRSLAETWPNRSAAASAFVQLSKLYRRLGEHEAAVAAAERAIELDPENLDGYTNRAAALQAQHGKTAIEEDCDRLAALELSEPVPLKKRAGLMSSCGRPEAALEDYAAAIELAPEWADPYYNRGNFRYNRREYAEALPDYDAAIERAPKWARPHRQHGLTLSKLKRYDEALVSISRAIELSPNSADAIYNRAQINFDVERWEDALTDLERCFELTGGRGNHGRWLQAQAFQRLGRDEEALEALAKMIEENPSSDLSHRRKANLLYTMGRVEDAVEAARIAVELAPGSAWNHFWLIIPGLYAESGCAEAAAQLDHAQSLAPDDAGFKSIVASVHAWDLYQLCPDQYDPALALQLAREGVDDRPDDPDRLYTLASVIYREGRFTEAREACRRAVELDTPRVWGGRLLLLSMIEQRLGNAAEARRLHEEAEERIRKLGEERVPDLLLARREAVELLGLP